jgi:hypothetical protein
MGQEFHWRAARLSRKIACKMVAGGCFQRRLGLAGKNWHEHASLVRFPSKRKAAYRMALRVLTILSATFLVAAFALALLAGPGADLQYMLAMINKAAWLAMQQHMEHGAPWMWRHIALPVLQRPAWLPLASAGLVCGGIAYSFTSRK